MPSALSRYEDHDTTSGQTQAIYLWQTSSIPFPEKGSCMLTVMVSRLIGLKFNVAVSRKGLSKADGE